MPGPENLFNGEWATLFTRRGPHGLLAWERSYSEKSLNALFRDFLFRGGAPAAIQPRHAAHNAGTKKNTFLGVLWPEIVRCGRGLRLVPATGSERFSDRACR